MEVFDALPPVVLVFLYGLLTALATGLGALPFAWIDHTSKRMLSAANAIAAGLMLGACHGLAVEGSAYGAVQTVAGGVVGLLAILLTEHLLRGHDLHVGQLQGAKAHKVLLVLAVMTVHSFSEGVAVGVAFGGGEVLATLITLAIAFHNIPEGLAISAVLRGQGASLTACAGWSIFSSLPQPIMAVPAFLFVEHFQPFLPYGLGFAAGAMVFMVFRDLLPDAYDHGDPLTVSLWTAVSLAGMLLFQAWL